MSLVKVADASGNTLTLLEWNGFRHPNINCQAVKELEDFKLREDDILICAYSKSGTHWVWEICRMVLAGTTDLKIVDKESQMIELTDPDKIDKEPSPRLINTHVLFDMLPKDFKKYRNKIIHLRRNPKDIAVSFYNHTKKFSSFYQYNGTWHDYLMLFIEGKVDNGSWFDYMLDWENIQADNPELDILNLTFEDLKEEPAREIRRICKFFEVTLSDEFIEEISEHCHFNNLKQRKGNLQQSVDGDSIIYRKGEVGDWKNWFTVAQNQHFDEVYKKKMAGSKLKVRYEI